MKDENLGLKEIRKLVKPVLKRHDVEKAEIFGSYAREEQTSESDIDILVEMEEGKTLVDVAELKKDLEEELGRDVDILTYNSVHPEIQEKVYSESVKI